MNTEQWKPIVDYEDAYDISDFGRVKRTKASNNTYLGRILKPTTNKYGYKVIHLSNNGIDHNYKVHGLVARTFIGPRGKGMQVNHKDGDKENNRLDNLEYVTPSENAFHAYRIGLMSQLGENHNRHKITEEDVREIRRMAKSDTHQSIADAFNISRPNVSLIVARKRWSHVA